MKWLMPAPPSMTLELGNYRDGSSCCDAQHSGAAELQGWLSPGCWATARGVISVFQIVFKYVHTLDPHGGFCLFFSLAYPGRIRISTESAFPPTFLCYAILLILRYVFIGEFKMSFMTYVFFT